MVRTGKWPVVGRTSAIGGRFGRSSAKTGSGQSGGNDVLGRPGRVDRAGRAEAAAPPQFAWMGHCPER